MNSQLDSVEEQTASFSTRSTFNLDAREFIGKSATDSEVPPSAKVRVEEFKMNGELLMAKVKELIQQSRVRRLIFKNSQGRILVDIPLFAGIAGGIVGITVFPVATTVASVAALVNRLSLAIERKDD